MPAGIIPHGGEHRGLETVREIPTPKLRIVQAPNALNMILLTDLSLSFLDSLPPNSNDHDIDTWWGNHVFPFVQTDDFVRNWRGVRDSNGQFITTSGKRCRIDAKAHHVPRIKVTVNLNGVDVKEIISYEAIVFSKLAFSLVLNKYNGEPSQVIRRRFVELVNTKFPLRWRSIIIQCGLETYEENKAWHTPTPASPIYTPLEHTQNIRLLHILPSIESHSSIRCLLEEADHTSLPNFEALSYVWGTSTARRSVIINEQPTSVGENLEAALRQLRPHNGKPRIMWIDAVCINQSDLTERSQQVAQMDFIYENAASVLIWLGRESITSAKVYGTLEMVQRSSAVGNNVELLEQAMRFPSQPVPYSPEFATEPHLLPPLPSSWVGTRVTERWAKDYAQAQMLNPESLGITASQWKDYFIDNVNAFSNLLLRQWWERVWVLQEAILAKKITLQCGPRSAPWEVFQMTLYNQIRLGKASGIYHTGQHNHREIAAHSILFTMAHKASVFFLMQRACVHAKKLPEPSMADLLSLTASFQATDSRDRLFSLISMLPKTSQERIVFRPDYTTDSRRLFIKAAKYFVTEMKSLAVTTARPRDPNYLGASRDIDRLPSWVPDWSKAQHSEVNSIWVNEFSRFKTLDLYMEAQSQQTKLEETYNTQNGKRKVKQIFNADLYDVSPFGFEFSHCDEVLHAKGERFDIIDDVGPPLDMFMLFLKRYNPELRLDRGAELHNEYIDVIQRWKSVARIFDEGPYPFTGQSRVEAFWRTLLLDRYLSGNEFGGYNILRLPCVISEEDIGQLFHSDCNDLQFPPTTTQHEGILISKLCYEIVEAWSSVQLNAHCAQLRLFRTRKGYIGLSHPQTQIGDEVTILLGAAVPMVLRRYPEGCIIIGQSYVHGVMDGEIIQARQVEGRGDSKEDYEDFRII